MRRIRKWAALAALAASSGGLASKAAAEDSAVAGPPAPAPQAEIIVIGGRSDLLRIPGSGATIEQADLERARVLTLNEALRQVAGVYPRDEEGLGLRPNIGVRGLNPTRSTKVLLLEDGLPLTYAPYGDNATYSHPPLRRFERIEVLKGASQIRFGPNSVGGVVNYITPRAPEEFGGAFMAALGDNGYAELDASLGGEAFGARLLAHVNSTTFDGVRANHDLDFNDVYLKAERSFAAAHDVTVRIGFTREDSQVSYSGLTEAEYAADPYGNPFPNDRFETERFTASATHAWDLGGGFDLRTSAYTLWFDRDWWRQSSNSAQRPNDSADPACGGMANLNTTCGNEGRLREYNAYGLETRLAWSGALFGADAALETGVRYHTERQNRLQANGSTPNARSGAVVEFNRRYADAWAWHATATLDYGRLAISPGVRFETIDYERRNLLAGAVGRADLEEVIPGLGITFDLRDDLVIYGGVHRGFAPPRAEDIVTNAGGTVELDAEQSVNYEIGLRGDLRPGLSFDIAAFRMAFDNQIVPASVAGGVGATLTSAGETLHAGLEASVRGSLRDMGVLSGEDDVYFRAAATYLPDASFEGARFSSIAGFGTVSVSGNRLPYAPEWIASAAIGYARGDWLTLQAEAQFTGEMFTDDLNTVAPIANGQRGLIDDVAIVNLTANFAPGGGDTALFVTVKNAFDETYIVDRARGILPGAPRLAQIGFSAKF